MDWRLARLLAGKWGGLGAAIFCDVGAVATIVYPGVRATVTEDPVFEAAPDWVNVAAMVAFWLVLAAVAVRIRRRCIGVLRADFADRYRPRRQPTALRRELLMVGQGFGELLVVGALMMVVIMPFTPDLRHQAREMEPLWDSSWDLGHFAAYAWVAALIAAIGGLAVFKCGQALHETTGPHDQGVWPGLVQPPSGAVSSDERHDIIIVHGTFAGPEAAGAGWYAPGGDFATSLAAHLEDTPLAGAVWRSSPDGFSWAAHLDHRERIEGAEKLAQRVRELALTSRNARIHLIGHSHGGNVVIKAVELHLRWLRDVALSALDLLACGDVPPSDRKTHVRDVLAIAAGTEPEQLPVGWVEVMSDVAENIPRTEVLGYEWARKHQAASAFAVSAPVHRLGRLIFMGTPFMFKQWARRRSQRFGHLRSAVRRFWLGVVGATVLFLSLFYGAWWVASLTPWFESPSHPLADEWFAGRLGLFLAGGLWLALQAERWNPRYDSNVYFDERDVAGDCGLPDGALPALVISAQHMDEALLGLSVEPLVNGMMLPGVRAVLHPHPAQARERRVGEPADIPNIEEWSAGTASAIRALLRLSYKVSLVVVWPVRRFVVEPAVAKVLSKTVASKVHGLPPPEFDGARIAVTPHLQTRIFREQFWDITAAALTSEPTATASAGPDVRAERFGHVMDDTLLEQKIAARLARETEPDRVEKLWTTLDSEIGRVAFALTERYHPVGETPVPPDELKTDMLRTSLTLEERLKEAVGAIELTHSLYYSNPAVVAGIADYLVSGEVSVNCDHSAPSVPGKSWSPPGRSMPPAGRMTRPARMRLRYDRPE